MGQSRLRARLPVSPALVQASEGGTLTQPWGDLRLPERSLSSRAGARRRLRGSALASSGGLTGSIRVGRMTHGLFFTADHPVTLRWTSISGAEVARPGRLHRVSE